MMNLPPNIPFNPYVFRNTDFVNGMCSVEFAVRNLLTGGKWFDPLETRRNKKNFMHEMVSELIHAIFIDVLFHGVEFNCNSNKNYSRVKFYLRHSNGLPVKAKEGLKKYITKLETDDVYLNADNMLVPACKILCRNKEKHRFVKINKKHLVEINQTVNIAHYKPKQYTVLNYMNHMYKKFPDVLPEFVDEICIRAIWNLALIVVKQEVTLNYFSQNCFIVYSLSDKDLFRCKVDTNTSKIHYKKNMAKSKWNGFYYIPLRDSAFYDFQETSIISKAVMYKWVEQAMAEESAHIVAVHANTVMDIIKEDCESYDTDRMDRNYFINCSEFNKWIYCYRYDKVKKQYEDVNAERNYKINNLVYKTGAEKKAEQKLKEKKKRGKVVKPIFNTEENVKGNRYVAISGS